MSDSDLADSLAQVPLFPLPETVLLPCAILPLHIFEERYKAMTADALAGSRRLAIALLRPGWEKSYKPAIEPVVCVGQIVACEELDEGKYNFLLQGQLRARVVRELPHPVYRIAELSPLPQTAPMEIDLEPERQRLRGLFDDGPAACLPIAKHFRELIAGAWRTSDIADLAAHNLLRDAQLKQAILADGDVRRRVGTVLEALEKLAPTFRSALRGFPGDPSTN